MSKIDEEDGAKLALGCVGAMFTVAMTPVLAIVGGLLFAQLWAWFIVPAFHVAPLTLPLAIGISLLVGFLSRDGGSSKQSFTEMWIAIVVKYSLTWVIGYIVHLFVVMP